jgi:hypothetical protein
VLVLVEGVEREFKWSMAGRDTRCRDEDRPAQLTLSWELCMRGLKGLEIDDYHA